MTAVLGCHCSDIPARGITLAMKTYKITELAGEHNLSRSALLYYDRIGLLSPSRRTPAGYRVYSEQDAKRLQTICRYRDAGLTLDDIRRLLVSRDDEVGIQILASRLDDLQLQMHRLRIKQATLCSLIKSLGANESRFVDKDMWTAMLRRAGMNDQDMHAWHAEFEHVAPHAHEAFLQWLGISQDEIHEIREWSRSLYPHAADS